MATTPPSSDPQVPGNYPGTVQNPTQVPAPVSPAADPEVPALPNDVDPNFIPNPAPVNNTIDPEVPQPEEYLTTKKKFNPTPVVPVTNPEVPQPTNEQNLFVDAPATVSSAANPEVPQPQPVQNYFTDRTPAPVENYFTDETPIVQNYFTDATPAPVENYFTDETPIVQNYFTDATPVSPAANPQVPEPTIVQNYFVDEPPIVQNYFTDETPIVQNFFTDDIPVNPAVNPQVPNIFSSIGALLSSLFGIRPTPVAPAANPQVAQAFPVPAPVVFTPTPIPPAANPQIPATPIVQNYFTDRTPAPVVPAANPQVPETPIVQNYFVDEPPIVQNYFTDAAPAPIVQNYFTDATPVSPAANPEVPQPTTDFGGRKKADPDIVDSPAEPAVQAQAETRIDGPVNQALLQQSNPAVATDYKSYVVDTQNKIVEQQTRELEVTQGFPASENQIAAINGEAFGTATIAANVRFKNQIESADAAQSVPANTPPPTIAPADVNVPALPNDVDPNFITNTAPVDNTIEPQAAQVDEALVAARAIDPNFIPLNDVSATTNPQVPSSANTRVENVNQSVLAQKDPALYQQWQGTFAARTEQNIARTIAAEEAVQGRPINAEDKALIVKTETFKARNETNAIYKDELQAANAATVVPTGTPPPTVATPAVTDTNQPEVQKQNSSVVTNVSQSTLAQQDPATYKAYQTDLKTTEAQLIQEKTAAAVAENGGQPLDSIDQRLIAAEANLEAKATVNQQYKDKIEAAGAGTVVPSGTPPPTVSTPPVTDANQPQVQAQNNSVVSNVNQTQLAEKDPALYQQWQGTFADRTEQNTTRAIASEEAVLGRPVTAEEKASIAGFSATQARFETNAIYKDELQAANAATVVPTGTPPPTVAAPAVADTNQPEVQSSASSQVSNVSTAALYQADPALGKEYVTYQQQQQKDLETAAIKEYTATEGEPPDSIELSLIRSEAAIQSKNDANAKYKDQIIANGVGTVTQTGTPPPTVAAPAVDSAVNQQVPTLQTGEPIIDPDNGEVLGYLNKETGQITDAPPAVSSAVDPQVVVPATKIEAVSTETLLQNDPKTAQEYTDFRNEQTLTLTSQRVVELEATTGTATTLAQQRQIAGQAFEDATADANFRYQDQIQAAGAATSVPADTPPPTVEAPTVDSTVDQQTPQPDDNVGEFQAIPAAPPVQSPSPFEIFLAQEAAATDAAQAEATARFNSQFDVVTEDPQAFPVDSGAVNPGRELAPVADTNTGYLDFNAADAAATAAADNIGEFQAEPAPVAITDGYLDFNAADAAATAAADNIGEFQAEPGTGDGESASFSDFSDGIAAAGGNFFGNLAKSAGAVSGGTDPAAGIFDSIFGGGSNKVNPKTTVSPQQAAANREKSAKDQAKQQSIINQQRKQANDGDWRVRLRLAASSNYLYNAPNPGILAPLSQSSGTGGVIFPYTPTITTAYQAKYNAYELTHSNYKGYFYQGSSVGDITINATFTAQDTQEANYLLAVIHFFRSVTKMFYGQDDAALRGAPPPLVFLQGLGEYQFNLHPCVVSNFNYTLPNDVDYIRALSPNNSGTNLTNRRSLQSGVSPFVNPSISRLQNAGLPQGGITTPTAPPTLGTNSPTYVPTKMDIQLTLLAIQTRSQVSNQFSLKNFANGDLIKGGFW